MTSITTAAGLLSFVTASSPPVVELGLFASFGVMMSLFFTFSLIPALIRVSYLKKKIKTAKLHSSLIDRFLLFCSRLSCSKPKQVVFVSLALTVISAIGISRLKVEQNMIESFFKVY